jgi:hypothetical protein
LILGHWDYTKSMIVHPASSAHRWKESKWFNRQDWRGQCDAMTAWCLWISASRIIGDMCPYFRVIYNI